MKLLTFLFFALFLSPTWASATIPEPVQVDTGFVTGAPTSSPEVRVFKGIPYAAPPVGRLRWRPPQTARFEENIRKADQFAPRCMQSGGNAPQGNAPQGGAPMTSEDCLYLNVWTAATSTGERRPVMVWIYGGAFAGGAGSLPGYNGEALAKKGVVVVTFNYRLGPFGWFAHPELTRESGHNASGNYGLMDAVAALQWVQRDILNFGGDARRVTVFGESAGAIMTAALVGSPLAKGLFQRAISESGAFMGVSIAPMTSLREAEQEGSKLATDLGAKSLAELRAKASADVQNTATVSRIPARLIVDGWYIPEDLSTTFAQGKQNDVDVLVGSNKDEATFPFFGVPSGNAQQFAARSRERFGDAADAFLKLYPSSSDVESNESQLRAFSDEVSWNMRTYAELQAKRGRRAFVYYFTQRPPGTPGQPNRGATHTAEIPYVFNNLAPGGAWTDADRNLADVMSAYWVSFATSVDPNGPGLPIWPAYHDKATGRAMLLGDKIEPEPAPDPARFAPFDALWARLQQAR